MSDCDECVLGFGIFFVCVMDIVCKYKTYSKVPGKLHKFWCDFNLIFKAMVLEFYVVVFLAEKIAVFLCNLVGFLIAAVHQKLWNFSLYTGGTAYESFMVFFEKLKVNAGFEVETVGECY